MTRPARVTLGVAVAVGLMFGPLDLAGQVDAPYPFANLFNSPAVWAAAAFVVGMWAKAPKVALVSAVVMEVIAVEAYYAADVVLRGADRSSLTSTTALAWLVLGVAAGVIFGTAGAHAQGGVRSVRIVARALLPAVFISEAAHEFLRHDARRADQRADDLLAFGVLLGLVAAVALACMLVTARRCDRGRIVGAVIVLSAIGTVGYAVVAG